MAKKAINFKSNTAKNNWIKAVHSIPSKTNPNKSVADATPGNTPLKVKGKPAKVNHDKMITPKTLPMGKPAMTISIIPVKKTSNNSKKKKGVN